MAPSLRVPGIATLLCITPMLVAAAVANQAPPRGGQEPGQPLRAGPFAGTPRRVFFYEDSRDHALISAYAEGDDAAFSVKHCDDACVDRLIVALHNPFTFPPDRPLQITFTGAVAPARRARLALGLADRQPLVADEPDALRPLLLDGRVRRVVWYSKGYQGLAVFHAMRASVIEGAPHVAIGHEEDLARIEAAGLAAVGAVDYGGAFPSAAGRTLGVARRIQTVQEANREAVAIHDAWLRVTGLGGQGCGEGQGDFCNDPSNVVDVVIYTGEEELGADPPAVEPLEFYDSTTVVTGLAGYVDADCGGGAGSCRPLACPQILPIRADVNFTDLDKGNCDRFQPTMYFPAGKGYDCRYDEDNGTETNFLEEAVLNRLYTDNPAPPGYGVLYDLRVNQNPPKTIRTVVIAAHWLDIPYRQKLFPYVMDGGCDAGCDGDADRQDADTDNDLGPPSNPSPCIAGFPPYITQNFKVGGWTGNSECDPAPDCASPEYQAHSCDPSTADDAYDGDTGSLDYFLADYRDDAGGLVYSYAHAAYGRIAGNSLGDAAALVGNANAFIASPPAQPSGMTAVVGSYGALGSGGYNALKAVGLCRYGQAKTVLPCDPGWGGRPGVRCANENLQCGGASCDPATGDDYTEAGDFIASAKVKGEIVVAWAHNPLNSYMDKKSVHFQRARLCYDDTVCPPDTLAKIVSSEAIDAAGGFYPPGVWSSWATSGFSYAYLGDGPGQSTFESALIPRGVIAIHGGYAHGGPPNTLTVLGDHRELFVKEIALSRPLGEAMRISMNVARGAWSEAGGEAFEIGFTLLGDPLLALPAAAQACPDKAAIVVSKGDSDSSPAGKPRARGFRKDATALEGQLDIVPFSASDVYGNTVTAGNFDGSGYDELASGRGPAYIGNDSTVKTFNPDGSPFAPLFVAFAPTMSDQYGANLAAGAIMSSSNGRIDIVAGRGHGLAFGPKVRVWTYDPACLGGPCFQPTPVNFDAWTGIGYGVNVAAGDVDGDGYADIVTGQGPDISRSSQMRVFEADGGMSPSLKYEFNAWSGGTWGTNPGTIDADGDGIAEICVGKGPGDQAVSGMDSQVKVFRWSGTSWQSKLSFPAFPDANPPGNAHGGARPAGVELDGTGVDDGDELAVIRGGATHTVTSPNGTPPDFYGSNVRVWDVTTGTPWGKTAIPLWTGGEMDAFEDDEWGPGQPSTWGGRLARIDTDLLQYPPGWFTGGGHERPLLTCGGGQDAAGEEPPPDPRRGSGEVARGLARYLGDLAENLFTRPGSKAVLVALLSSIERQLAAGSLAGALGETDALLAATAVEGMVEPTRRELLYQFRGLRGSIDRHLGNRPPDVVVYGGGLHRVPWGDSYRPALWAGASTDPDSTPGTRDNIMAYRWYSDAGDLIFDDAHLPVTLDHGERGIATHRFRVEVDDAYGATSSATVEVTVVGVAP